MPSKVMNLGVSVVVGILQTGALAIIRSLEQAFADCLSGLNLDRLVSESQYQGSRLENPLDPPIY